MHSSTCEKIHCSVVGYMLTILGVLKVVLVGHSSGGACLSYALEHFSNKISKAVYVSATMVADGQRPFDVFIDEVCNQLWKITFLGMFRTFALLFMLMICTYKSFRLLNIGCRTNTSRFYDLILDFVHHINNTQHFLMWYEMCTNKWASDLGVHGIGQFVMSKFVFLTCPMNNGFAAWIWRDFYERLKVFDLWEWKR